MVSVHHHYCYDVVVLKNEIVSDRHMVGVTTF